MRKEIKYNPKMATNALKLFVLLFLLMGAGSCKKFPENTLWFKNPKNLRPFNNSRLTKYTVNGIDSLELLNGYFGHSQNLVRDIHLVQFTTDRDGSYEDYDIVFGGGYELYLSYTLLNRNRKIKIGMAVDSNIFLKHLFMGYETEWEIQRFAKTGPFKIKTTLENGNLYELAIE